MNIYILLTFLFSGKTIYFCIHFKNMKTDETKRSFNFYLFYLFVCLTGKTITVTWISCALYTNSTEMNGTKYIKSDIYFY